MLEYVLLVALLGLLPGAIAHARGLPFLTWWLYGVLIWPVALVHAFFAKPGSVVIASRSEARTRVCPHCAETIKTEAKVCKHCGRDVPAASSAPAPSARPMSRMFTPYDPGKRQDK